MENQNRIAYEHITWGIIFGIIAIVLLVSCGNKSKDTGVSKVTYDTANSILAYYIPPDQSKIAFGPIVRVTIDSTMWKLVDSVTIKKEPGLDTTYFVSHFPSFQDSTGLMYLDSAAGRKAMMGWWQTDKSFVRNGWEDGDSALKYLSQFVKPKK